MIVPFAIDPAALLPSEPDAPVDHFAHLRLLECWREVGVLVLPTEATERTRLIGALRRLPQVVRKRWEKALESQRRVTGPDAPAPRLVIVPHAALEGRLRHPRHASIVDGSVEWCRFDGADRARGFLLGRRLAASGIPRGCRVDDLWRERFSLIAAVSRHVTVVDRYALKNHLDWQGQRTSGIERLLTELDRTGIPKTVTVFAQSIGKTREPALDELAARLGHGKIRELHIGLGDFDAFTHHAHDRHVRLDDTLIQLGKGVEVLGGDEVFAASDCDLKVSTLFARLREQELRASSRFVRYRVEDDGLRRFGASTAWSSVFAR